MKYKMTKPVERVMLEDETGMNRIEFFSRPIYESNIDRTVAYYEPIVRHCTNLITGSTYIDERVAVERGNAIYQKALINGYKRVKERSFA